MDSFSLYRDRIGETLTRRLAEAIRQEVVTLEDAAEISNTILTKIDNAMTHAELIDFVDELAHKWPLFGPVLAVEQAQQKTAEEKNVVDQVSSLLKENKVEEALIAAERANSNASQNPTDNNSMIGGTN